MTNLTIKERLDLLEHFVKDPQLLSTSRSRAYDAVEVTEKVLDIYYIPKTKEYLNYLMYTTEGVLSNKDVIEGYLKDCIKGFEGTYEPFRESLTFNYGFRPLSEEEFVYKGEEFIQDSRWSPQANPVVYDRRTITTIEDIQRIHKEIEENEREIRRLEEKRFNTIVNSIK